MVDSGSQKRRPCTGRVFNQSETVWNTPNADVLVLARMLGKEIEARRERLDGMLSCCLAQALDKAIGRLEDVIPAKEDNGVDVEVFADELAAGGNNAMHEDGRYA